MRFFQASVCASALYLAADAEPFHYRRANHVAARRQAAYAAPPVYGQPPVYGVASSSSTWESSTMSIVNSTTSTAWSYNMNSTTTSTISSTIEDRSGSISSTVPITSTETDVTTVVTTIYVTVPYTASSTFMSNTASPVWASSPSSSSATSIPTWGISSSYVSSSYYTPPIYSSTPSSSDEARSGSFSTSTMTSAPSSTSASTSDFTYCFSDYGTSFCFTAPVPASSTSSPVASSTSFPYISTYGNFSLNSSSTASPVWGSGSSSSSMELRTGGTTTSLITANTTYTVFAPSTYASSSAWGFNSTSAMSSADLRTGVFPTLTLSYPVYSSLSSSTPMLNTSSASTASPIWGTAAPSTFIVPVYSTPVWTASPVYSSSEAPRIGSVVSDMTTTTVSPSTIVVSVYDTLSMNTSSTMTAGAMFTSSDSPRIGSIITNTSTSVTVTYTTVLISSGTTSTLLDTTCYEHEPTMSATATTILYNSPTAASTPMSYIPSSTIEDRSGSQTAETGLPFFTWTSTASPVWASSSAWTSDMGSSTTSPYWTSVAASTASPIYSSSTIEDRSGSESLTLSTSTPTTFVTYASSTSISDVWTTVYSTTSILATPPTYGPVPSVPAEPVPAYYASAWVRALISKSVSKAWRRVGFCVKLICILCNFCFFSDLIGNCHYSWLQCIIKLFRIVMCDSLVSLVLWLRT